MQLPSGATLSLVRGDITTQQVDAIVNAANETLLGGGGVDGAIHKAAGPLLLVACRALPEHTPGMRCRTGEAAVTEAFDLPAKHVIHTVGPRYHHHPEPQDALASAYRSSLDAARSVDAHTVAFPAISCGVYAFPVDEAARIALSTVSAHAHDLDEVRFVLFGDDTWQAWSRAAEALGLDPD